MLTMIWAEDKNGVIGLRDDGKDTIPWKCKTDMQLFKAYTIGKLMVVGRKTYATLPPVVHNGRVIRYMTTKVMHNRNSDVIYSVAEVLSLASKSEVIIAGGAQIYNLFMPYADKLVVSEINYDSYGEVAITPEAVYIKAPDIDYSRWVGMSNVKIQDKDNGLTLRTFVRKRN